jgi:hypothetical protein
MKKLLFFIVSVLFFTALQVNAQTTVFEENFGSITEPDLPTNWVAVDRDEDGSGWEGDSSSSSLTNTFGFSDNFVYSFSFFSNPDNLLVTPSITLASGSPATLTFLIGGYKASGLVADPHEHYAIYVLPSGSTFQGTEIPLLEETIADAGIAYSKSIDLSGFGGQSIKIYFRHFNSSNQLALILDTVKVTQGSLGTLEVDLAPELTVYPNPAKDYVSLQSKSKILKTEVFDLTGRKVGTEWGDGKVNIQQLSPGNYLMKITTEHKTYSRKIIKK